MYNKTIKVFAYFLPAMLLTGCLDRGPDFPAGDVQGYRPIYGTKIIQAITFDNPRPLLHPGKIYSYGNLLAVNEQKQGIHIFDNTDPSSPKPLGFVVIPGNVDIAMKNNVLYADTNGSIVALDVSDLNHIKELSRIATKRDELLPQSGYYFECINPDKGVVIGWTLAQLHNPECYR